MLKSLAALCLVGVAVNGQGLFGRGGGRPRLPFFRNGGGNSGGGFPFPGGNGGADKPWFGEDASGTCPDQFEDVKECRKARREDEDAEPGPKKAFKSCVLQQLPGSCKAKLNKAKAMKRCMKKQLDVKAKKQQAKRAIRQCLRRQGADQIAQNFGGAVKLLIARAVGEKMKAKMSGGFGGGMGGGRGGGGKIQKMQAKMQEVCPGAKEIQPLSVLMCAQPKIEEARKNSCTQKVSESCLDRAEDAINENRDAICTCMDRLADKAMERAAGAESAIREAAEGCARRVGINRRDFDEEKVEKMKGKMAKKMEKMMAVKEAFCGGDEIRDAIEAAMPKEGEEPDFE